MGLIVEAEAGGTEFLGQGVLGIAGAGSMTTVDETYPFWGQKATAENHYNQRSFTIRARTAAIPDD